MEHVHINSDFNALDVSSILSSAFLVSLVVGARNESSQYVRVKCKVYRSYGDCHVWIKPMLQFTSSRIMHSHDT
jgi:hypothetical protein